MQFASHSLCIIVICMVIEPSQVLSMESYHYLPIRRLSLLLFSSTLVDIRKPPQSIPENSGREPMMARKPDMTLFKTASDSLARRKILADFSIPQERLSKVTTGVVFRCHTTQHRALAKSVSNQANLQSHVTIQFKSFHGNKV